VRVPDRFGFHKVDSVDSEVDLDTAVT
jgi:hypothetical protein